MHLWEMTTAQTTTSIGGDDASRAEATEGTAKVLGPREKYLLEMRKRFCPPEMIDASTGDLNEVYFQPPKPKRVLKEEEEDLVADGIEKFGVGKWSEMAKEFFPNADADVNEIKIVAMKLLGKQDLREYEARKLSRQEIEAELEKNLIDGKSKNLLVWGKVLADERYGLLV